MNFRLPLFALTLLLAGCDIPGLGPDPKIAQREADAQAIGGACRNGLRSIEDCYALNERASKAAIYAGWREMDQYMRDNKLEGTPAKLSNQEPVEETVASSKTTKAPAEAPTEKPGTDSKAKGKGKPGDKPADKPTDKPSDKPADKVGEKPADKPAPEKAPAKTAH